MCAANPTHLRRKSLTFAPQIPHICAANPSHLRRRWPHLRRRWPHLRRRFATFAPQIRHICAAHVPHLRRTCDTFAPHIRHICAASMCDLRRLHVRSAWRSLCSSRAARRVPAAALPRGCGGRQRPLAVHPRTRRANPGILKWWQVRRLASCRTPRHGGYSTPSLVTRRRRRVTSFAFPSGGAPTGASANSTYNAPSGPGSPARCVCAAGCLLRALPLPAARAAATRRTLAGCVCAAGCRTPHARLTLA